VRPGIYGAIQPVAFHLSINTTSSRNTFYAAGSEARRVRSRGMYAKVRSFPATELIFTLHLT
jgi:hypothetical protein